ncbi:MAG: sulfatase-like hydrolase/transferase [Betaproteobacteria bacterium]
MTAGAGSALLGGTTDAQASGSSVASAAPIARKRGAADKHNIIFVFTDQERFFPRLPAGYSLPGHERLARNGVTFENHYCPAVMCTSSRAVLLTGLQTTDNRMFESADAPWVQALSTKVPTVGHMLRKAGYYTAYKGKWDLNRAFDDNDGNRLFTREMEEYGFADFAWPGDVLAHGLGGYRFDHLISGSAISWLRNKGRPLAEDGKPWALFVSLVNPHDIMYFNTDLPGERVQDTGRLMMQPTKTPPHPDYKARWNAPLPENLTQPFDEPGRPRAHGEFDRAWGVHARAHSARGGALAALHRLLPELRARGRCAIACHSERTGGARSVGPHHFRVHVRPRRDGGRAWPARQRCLRL